MSGDDVLLVRVYGKKSDLLIDREREMKAMVILHKNGCAAPIFCRFQNGIAYGFVSGVMVNLELSRKLHVQRYFCVIVSYLFLITYSIHWSSACASSNH